MCVCVCVWLVCSIVGGGRVCMWLVCSTPGGGRVCVCVCGWYVVS